MMNKKGGEKWLSIWWYFCLALILAGTVIATWRYQAASDASELDANVLVNRIAGCVVTDGKLSFSIDSLNIEGLCHMKPTDKDYFFDVQVYAVDECKKIPETGGLECSIKKDFPFEPIKGYKNGDLRDRCIHLEGIKVTQMPECAYKTIYAIGKDNKRYILRIIGGTHE